MNPFLSAAIAFSLSQVLLSIILLIRTPRTWSVQEKLICCFLVATASYLLFPVVEGHWLEHYIVTIHTLLPGIFWLLCASLFDDNFKLRWWNVCVVALTGLLPTLGLLFKDLGLFWPATLLLILPQVLEFILLGLSFIVVMRFWRVDLVEARRDLRLWICALIGPYVFTLVLFREVIFPGAQWLSFWQYMPVGLVCLLTNILMLQYKRGLVAQVLGKSVEKKQQGTSTEADGAAEQASDTVEVPEAIVNELDTLVRRDHIYREMGLTIGDMARKLDIPEYRLRKIINSGLGYRNFNDFLNGYRIQEAGERLINPKYSNETILNIALDIGFRSLSSFNKVFRERYSQTPTEFRNNALKKDACCSIDKAE